VQAGNGGCFPVREKDSNVGGVTFANKKEGEKERTPAKSEPPRVEKKRRKEKNTKKVKTRTAG